MEGMLGAPAAQGLYRPEYEHDACGVAFVAQLSGEASHEPSRSGLMRRVTEGERIATSRASARARSASPASRR